MFLGLGSLRPDKGRVSFGNQTHGCLYVPEPRRRSSDAHAQIQQPLLKANKSGGVTQPGGETVRKEQKVREGSESHAWSAILLPQPPLGKK